MSKYKVSTSVLNFNYQKTNASRNPNLYISTEVAWSHNYGSLTKTKQGKTKLVNPQFTVKTFHVERNSGDYRMVYLRPRPVVARPVTRHPSCRGGMRQALDTRGCRATAHKGKELNDGMCRRGDNGINCYFFNCCAVYFIVN